MLSMSKGIETIGSINLLYVVALSKMNTVCIVLSRKSNIVSQAKTETTRCNMAIEIEHGN